jgi:carbon-monoxide dehydrogenase large subunit
MPGSILGNRVRRLEDPELLTGQGTFIANLRIPGMLRAAFVRSPIAHARIERIDTSVAQAMPGVVAVLIAEDLGVAPFHGFMVLNEACARPPLASGKVRFVGDPVAVVIAESEEQALDAMEMVEVDYDPLPAVADMVDAVADGAPLQFEEMGTNVVAGIAGKGSPLDGAAHVVRARLENQRVAVVPMEGNAIAAIPGGPAATDAPAATDGAPAGDDFLMTIYVSTQMPHGFADAVKRVLGYNDGEIRVIAPHVGGGFGAKAGLGAEHAAVIAAARHLGRPIRWVETRSENLIAMPHGRGQVQWIEMGFDDQLKLTGMHCRVLGDAGAYAGFGGALAVGPTRNMAQGVYAFPQIRYDVAVAVTNTTPMGAFRGAGRPEAAEFLERMMDISALELGVDPVELRRRNLLPAFDGAYKTLMGPSYDNGDYAHALDVALEAADYRARRAEQRSRREAGHRWQLGIGVAVYVEITAGGGGQEYGSVEVHGDGSATIRVGTSAHGQGHATSFAMIVSEHLGIPMERISFVQSDTAAVPRGGGTGGSRSLQVGGSAVLEATNEVLDQARAVVAKELEANPEDVVVHDDGGLGVAGVPSRTMTWSQVVAATGAPSLQSAVDFKVDGPTFPFGAHVSVVEVDTETGQVRPVRHVAVDDCGRILNPLLVTGQQHGGIAQGMAQALWEEVVFDAEGNPQTANLADYGMPSAAEMPSFETFNTETPTYRNPLGAKGIGESGTIGSTPSVHNAVVDAVAHLGVRHIPMPCTPQRVWQALQAAEAGGSVLPWSEPPVIFDRQAAATSPRNDRPEAADVDI